MKKRHQSFREKLEAERKRRAAKPQPFPFHGDTFRTEHLVPTHFETELGIYQADAALDRQLTDQHVRTALESLIRQMQTGTLPELGDGTELHYREGEESNLLSTFIRRNWQHLWGTKDQPTWEETIGVLRTILGDVLKRGSSDADSRGYLNFLEEFLRAAGVSVRIEDAD